MSQLLGTNSVKILAYVKQQGKITVYSFIKSKFKNESYRKIYTQIYQLEKRGYLEKYRHKDSEFLHLTAKGENVLATLKKERDGKWRMIIFDIPETKRDIRDFLRVKLKQLGFKKWQNSIWITPFILPREVEDELLILSHKFFVRLVTIQSINNDSDLLKLFEGELG